MARKIIANLEEAMSDQPRSDKSKRVTLNTMYRHAEKLFGRPHKQDRKINILDVKPFFGTRWIQFDARSTGEGTNKKNQMYDLTMVFYDVDFQDERDAAHPQVINLVSKSGPNEVIVKWAAPCDANTTPTSVFCSCADFRFRWEWYLKKVGSLASGRKARPYTRKTDTRPPANPNRSPGFCKHLYQLTLLIKATYPQLLKNFNA